ncbi:DUF448 domain-containing protein [bacterium]|nr:DUF448 domain-containing protein [bacterium]
MRSDLLRFQLDNGLVRHIATSGQSLAGRSVYLCADHGCLRAVLKRGVLVFRHSKYAKIIVRLNREQVQRLARAFRRIPGK